MLLESQIDKAIDSFSAYKESFSSSRHSELIGVVLSGLNELKTIPDRDDTIFAREFRGGFEDLSIFRNTVSEDLLSRQLQFVFVFLYALYLERLLQSSSFGSFTTQLMSVAANAAQVLDPEFCVRLELFRGKVIGNLQGLKIGEYVTQIKSDKDSVSERLLPLSAKLDNWESVLAGWQEKVDALETKIKGEYGKLNFVGLSDAFSRLIEKKYSEKNFQIGLMVALGLLILSVPVISFCLIQKIQLPLKLESLIYAAPISIALILLLYFFRIALRNFYSVKAQLLQLELRYHVCAFIQGYSDFVAQASASKTPAFLDKFDSLVFGGISADIQNIPTQFDGFDSLLAVLKELKSKT